MLADKLERQPADRRAGRQRCAQAHELRRARGPARRSSTGWLGAFEAELGERQPDRPRPVHALQCLHRSLPRERDRLQLPDRPRTLQRATATACASATPPARSTSTARRRPCAETFDLVLDLRGAAGVRDAPAAAGLLPRRQRRTARCARRCSSCATRVGEFEKPKFFRLQAEDLRAQPQRADRLHRLHRRLLGARDPQRRVAERQGRGRHQARRADAAFVMPSRRRHRRRAAPVRRLRRLQHGLPERRDVVRLSRPRSTRGGALRTLLRAYRARRRTRRGAADPQRRRRRAR